MSLSTRLHTSWQLLGSSVRVLRDQPRLLLFPVVTMACTLAMALFFLAPIVFLGIEAGAFAEGWEAAAQEFKPVFYGYGAVVYLASMFIATFFNVAFYHETMRALAGESISLRRGWEFAFSRLGAIVCWSLLAGVVGLIIKAIEERMGWLGRIVMGFVGTAWSVAAVFAIPIIVRRSDRNPIAVLRDSAVLLKRTWGEALVGFVGFQLATALIVVGLILGLGAAVVVGFLLHLSWFPFLLLAVGIVGIVATGIFLGVATDVYRCALYLYASEGVVPGPYTTEMMNAGWKVKPR